MISLCCRRRYVDIRDKTSRLAKINAKKTKVMQVNARKDQRIEINGEQVDEMEEFVYLDALLDKA